MCGRYTLRRADLAAAVFRATKQPEFEEFSEFRFTPRFNIAPSQQVAIVRPNSKGERVIGPAEWGLVPSWTKGKPKSRPINARAENIGTSGMFRQALQRRRCLVPADGFYEWKADKPPKQPYFIHRPDHSLFAFAGLWERWKPSEDAESIDTFTIITTVPNALMRQVHNRMPVILQEANFDQWLDRDVPGEKVLSLLQPDEQPLEIEKTSTAVNNVRNEGPDLLKPIK